ncbi:glycosyltransferase family 4 protein [Flavimaricola marinus]|uniref:D-inositol 3-phosphate glycosyltransferase n=1 Tax=Flavimaricola marinus TaxID=1819565 RepID=A0A238LGX0_9RHOB|nr:glycosyltransferase family 4 protein [Flavimaricola marinus]SMY08206.1 D-inositol 3-phosphate glycosyltransferase [Flavimaricola marinus]
MSQPEKVAIFFHPDAVEGEGREIVGRRSAGQSFLKGFLAHAGGDEVRAYVDAPKAAKAFDEAARALGETRPLRVPSLRGGFDPAFAGTVFFPTPGFQGTPWQRMRHGPASCSLVGITHTVSTRRIIEGIHQMLAEPVEPWDAVICTSHAVKSVVARQFEAEAEFFRARYGATRVPQPQLPVIPLGIAADDFTPRDGARARMRAAQGAREEAVVVLTMGRMSVIEKANPIPLLLALEQVAHRTGREVHLWMTGWASREEEEALHRTAAEALCDRVQVRFLDGRDPDIRRDVWAGADIFTLPADSIQETFGLVPVEAMAAGLPVVMPDWDGFRDTVIHGETGLLVPTRMAPVGSGAQLARRFAEGVDGYLQYLALVQAQVQIEVPAYAAAFEALIRDPALRAKMGRQAAAHVRATLDWSAVIPQYLALAEDLAALRGAEPPKRSVNPLQIDPFTLYQDYPSTKIRPDDVVTLVRPVTPEEIALHSQISGRELYRRHAVPPLSLHQACQWLEANGPTDVTRLAQGLQTSVNQALIIVLILAKSDMVRLPEIPFDPPSDAGRRT